MGKSKFIKGGRKLDKFFRDAKRANAASAKDIEVGFFPEDKHEPTGLPVAHIAGKQEFGVPGEIPERPFFRGAIRTMETTLGPILKANLSTLARWPLICLLAKKLGAAAVLTIRKSIVTLRTPANAPFTKAQKRGSNPLIDSRQILKSVKAKIRT